MRIPLFTAHFKVATLRWGGLVLACTALTACFGNSPQEMNAAIDKGDATSALTKAEEKLANLTGPEAAPYALIAAKARIALCAQRACTVGVASNTLPALLQPLNGLLTQARTANIPGKDKKAKPLTLPIMLEGAITTFQTLPNQPFPMLVLADAAPTFAQPQLQNGFFIPALNAARKGQANAGPILLTLAEAPTLQEPLPTLARFMGHTLNHQPAEAQPYLIALRSVPASSTLPPAAARLLTWATLANTSSTTPSSLANQAAAAPETLRTWQIPLFKSPALLATMAQEASSAVTTTSSGTNQLALQRLALTLNPNQPALWASYLKQLVQNTPRPSPSSTTVAASPNLLSSGLPLADITSATAAQLGTELLTTANQLQNTPAVAVPLIVLASQLTLSNPQQVQLDKLAQTLIVKAAEQHDIPTTLALAQAKPQVAQSNRHLVVPLLVQGVRKNLQDGKFEKASALADILTTSLHLNIEYGPIILEEFTADMERQGIPAELAADTPEDLLQPQDDVTLDLGPLFGFMQTYFATQPDVLTSQLTTLIAQAAGRYGPATAMYKLGPSFPSSTMPVEKQQEWLATALTAALTEDETLSGSTMVKTAIQLVPLHPGFTLAPALEAALRKTPNLTEQRQIWQQSTPNVRAVFRAIRPQFEALMRGIDAMEAGKLATAADAFELLADPATRATAAPYLQRFLGHLQALAGLYIPIPSANGTQVGTSTPAAIILSPAALAPNAPFSLNTVSATFIARLGRTAEPLPDAYRTSRGEAPQLTLSVPFQFDTRTLALTPDVLAQSPHGLGMAGTYGAITTLKATTSGNTNALSVTFKGGQSITYTRALANPTGILFPNGAYLINGHLPTTSETKTILPTGTILKLQASPDARAPQPEDDAPTGTTTVYPLIGTVQHPASIKPLPLEGIFDPTTLTSTFTFTYPLPQSARPVKTEVRCQTLTTRIVCGAHHTHSPRAAFTAISYGLETQESAAANTAHRALLNEATLQDFLSATRTPEVTSPTSSTSSTLASGTQPAATSVVPLSAQPTSSSTVSGTQPPSPSTPLVIPVGAFVRKTASGTEIITSTTPVSPNATPGTFIHKLSTSTTPLF